MEGCGDAIPSIDDCDGGAEPSQFIRREVFGNGCVVFVGDVMFGEAGEKFCPGKRSLLTLGKDASLAPDREQVKLGCGDAHVTRFIEVKLGAEGAAIDLRGTQFDELL